MKKNIGVITLPIGKSGAYHLINLIQILDPISYKISVITGNSGFDLLKNDQRIITIGTNYQTGKNPISRVLKFLFIQIRVSWQFLLYCSGTDIWIFYLGTNLIFPKIIAKILRKTIIELSAGSPTATMAIRNDPFLVPMKFLSSINFMLSDKIVLYSKNLMKEWQLEAWEKKIFFAPRHFVDFSLFHRTNEMGSRKMIIGFVGRLSEEKGILNLLKAIPNIIQDNPSAEFIIIGDGKLQNEISEFIEKNGLTKNVSLVGWCDQEKMPEYLNMMKLLIVPSFTEGLPNVILEAMACGTPVLASSVGSVPDIISDKDTGFLLIDNSPEFIEKEILRVLECEDLELISANAETYVRSTFSLSAARSRIEKILYCQ